MYLPIYTCCAVAVAIAVSIAIALANAIAAVASDPFLGPCYCLSLALDTHMLSHTGHGPGPWPMA